MSHISLVFHREERNEDCWTTETSDETKKKTLVLPTMVTKRILTKHESFPNRLITDAFNDSLQNGHKKNRLTPEKSLNYATLLTDHFCKQLLDQSIEHPYWPSLENQEESLHRRLPF